MIEREDAICNWRNATLTCGEEKKILSMLAQNKLDVVGANPMIEIKRKKDLKNYSLLRLELFFDNYHIMIGLADVNVDDEKNELTGVRVLRYRGEYTFEKYVFYLKDYNKKWKAWGHEMNL